MNNTLATNLKEFRVQNGLKQKEIAEKLNLKQQTYSRYENGEREPDIDLLMTIADFYRLPIDVLVGRYQISKPTRSDSDYKQ